VAAVVLLLTVQSASTESPVITFAVSGAQVTRPVAVNNRGVVAGTYTSPTGYAGVFVRDAGGTIATVELADVQFFLPGVMDLNISGTLVGTYLSTVVPARGFVRTPDGFTTPFDIPGADYTILTGINDRGAMIGAYVDSSRPQGVGFVVSPTGDVTDLTGPADVLYFPQAINTAGAIAGVTASADGTSIDMFYRDARGDVTHFGIQHTSSNAEVTYWELVDMNAAGIVAGNYATREFVGGQEIQYFHNFLRYPDGTVETFTVPDSSHSSVAQGIDAAGGVAGYYTDTYGSSFGFHRSRNGRFTTIALDEGLQTRVEGVSPSGLMVGSTVQFDHSGTYSLKEVGFIMR
jgi:hypothetical protein